MPAFGCWIGWYRKYWTLLRSYKPPIFFLRAAPKKDIAYPELTLFSDLCKNYFRLLGRNGEILFFRKEQIASKRIIPNPRDSIAGRKSPRSFSWVDALDVARAICFTFHRT